MAADISDGRILIVPVVCTNSGKCMVDGCPNGVTPPWMSDGSCVGRQKTLKTAFGGCSLLSIFKIRPVTGNAVLPARKLGQWALGQRRQYSPGTMSPLKFGTKIREVGEGESVERLDVV